MNHERWNWAGLCVAGAVVLGGAFLVSPPPASTHRETARPECPHDWDAKAGQFDEVGPILDIPEFHDCQRFIVYDPLRGALYDSLFAIFAVPGVRGIEQRLDSTTVCAECAARLAGPGGGRSPAEARSPRLRARATTLGVVAARVYAEGDYQPLGIRQGHNCLYLFRAGPGWGALMVPVSDAYSSCRKPIDPAVPWGTELQVRRTTPGGGPADYPAVARWDWDSVHVQQYLGVGCGTAWCEIGEFGFNPSSPPQLDPAVATLLGRTAMVKGWYDEQFLALLDDDRKTRPSLVRGRIFPALGLDGFRRVDGTLPAAVTGAFRTWTTAAWIVLDTVPSFGLIAPGIAVLAAPTVASDSVLQYTDRLNVGTRQNAAAAIATQHLNELQVCHGNREECGIPGGARAALATCDTDAQWWTRIIAAGEAGARYLCMTRRGHENLAGQFEIPGTARWRWMASDEGVWHACGQGCCETLGPGG